MINNHANHSSFAASFIAAGHAVSEAASTAVKHVNNCVYWLNHKVTYYCNYLPHPLNVIAKAALEALPFILLQACLPTPLYIASIVAISVYAIATVKARHQSSVRAPMLNAAAFQNFYRAGTNAVAFAVTGQIPSLLWTISSIGFGISLALTSHLAQDVFRIPRRPDPLHT